MLAACLFILDGGVEEPVPLGAVEPQLHSSPGNLSAEENSAYTLGVLTVQEREVGIPLAIGSTKLLRHVWAGVNGTIQEISICWSGVVTESSGGAWRCTARCGTTRCTACNSDIWQCGARYKDAWRRAARCVESGEDGGCRGVGWRGARWRGGITARAIAGNNLPVDTLGAGGGGAEADQTSLVTNKEGGAVSPTEDLAVGGAVAVVVGTDSHLGRVAVGAWGDGAEVEVFGAG